MKDYRSLLVWRKAHGCALEVYRLTESFPSSERFGLTSQLRRAAVSVPSHHAEGCGRGSDADYPRFVQQALGSACEVEYQMLLAYDLRYLKEDEFQPAAEATSEVCRMLAGLLKVLRRGS